MPKLMPKSVRVYICSHSHVIYICVYIHIYSVIKPDRRAPRLLCRHAQSVQSLSKPRELLCQQVACVTSMLHAYICIDTSTYICMCIYIYMSLRAMSFNVSPAPSAAVMGVKSPHCSSSHQVEQKPRANCSFSGVCSVFHR